MAPSTALWNPPQVLRLGLYSPEESSTCIGHAPSKNRRCRNAIAAANQQEASKLLDRIGSTEITGNVDLSEELEEIAERLLCKRWHQNQALLVAGRWMEKVENFRTNAEGERRRAVTAREEGDVTSVTTTTTTTRSTSTTESSTTTVQTVAGAARTTASLRTSSPPTTTSTVLTEASSTERTLLSPAHPTPPTSEASSPTTRTEPPPSAVALPLADPLLTPPPPSSSSSDPQPPATPPPSIEDCPVCYDDVHDDEQTTLNCAHSFHTVCIRTWFANQDGCSRPRTCPCCRHEKGNEWVLDQEGDEME